MTFTTIQKGKRIANPNEYYGKINLYGWSWLSHFLKEIGFETSNNHYHQDWRHKLDPFLKVRHINNGDYNIILIGYGDNFGSQQYINPTPEDGVSATINEILILIRGVYNEYTNL